MTVLLVIGGIGLAVLLLAFLLGDIFDGLLDLDMLGSDFFSLAGLAGFVGAFGFGGAIALHLVGHLGVAVGVGVLAGLLVGFGAAWLTARLKDETRDGDVTVRADHLIGALGRVINDIPADGLGEIRVVVHGHPTKLNARAAEAIAAGTLIEVTGVLSPTSVMVRHGEPIDPPRG